MTWDHHIIHTALLGTGKASLKKEELPAGLADAIERIQQGTEGGEEQFLQIAALVKNYRQCGVMPLQKENVEITPAQEEEKPYAGRPAHDLLSDILAEESVPLTAFWLQLCAGKNLVVQPELVPALLDAGVKNKSLRQLVMECTGRRGEWLSQFNEAWKVQPPLNEEEIWQTGTTEQRRLVLQLVRQKDPARAREWLRQSWSQENANTKADLLQQLFVNIGEDDKDWLETLLAEKSIKVKEEAISLLKRIPSSIIVQQYKKILEEAVRVKKEKGIPGLRSKASLEISLPELDESIFKTGIEKVSSDKNKDDNDFILYQLIAAVPPSFWEQHFNEDKETVIDRFLKSKGGKEWVIALGMAAAKFKDLGWLRAAIAVIKGKFLSNAVPVLPPQEREQYILSFMETTNTNRVIELLTACHTCEWGLELTKTVFKYTANNPYNFNKSFYSNIIGFIPISIVAELEKCTPSEPYLVTMWSNTSEYIIKLLTLKLETYKAFHQS